MLQRVDLAGTIPLDFGKNEIVDLERLILHLDTLLKLTSARSMREVRYFAEMAYRSANESLQIHYYNENRGADSNNGGEPLKKILAMVEQ